MSCFMNGDFVWSSWQFPLWSSKDDELDNSVDQLLWSHDLGSHSTGEFSHAVVQANVVMEDHSLVEVADGAIFVGVYDGHGGEAASKFVRDQIFARFNNIAKGSHSINERALRRAYDETQTEFLNLVHRERVVNSSIISAQSCCVAGVIWRGMLYVVSGGDSRVVIGRKCLSGGLCVEQLTEDDKTHRASYTPDPNSLNSHDQELEHFLHKSWHVKSIKEGLGPSGNGFSGCLNRRITHPALSPLPRVHTRELGRKDKFVIFASHGLWDLISNKKAAKIVNKHPRKGIAKRLIQQAMREAARKKGLEYDRLKNVWAGNRLSVHDDISVVVVFIDSGQERPVIAPVRITGFAKGPEPGRFDLGDIN